MRELAREANLAPATLTRLARQLGLSGFDDVKQLYAEEARQYAAGYRRKAVALADLSRREGATGLALYIVAGIARQAAPLPATTRSRSLAARVPLLLPPPPSSPLPHP